MSAGLVDEYQMIVCPVVLGDGKRLFREENTRKFELVNTHPFDGGTVLLSYRPRGS